MHKVPSEPYEELVKLSTGASHLEFNKCTEKKMIDVFLKLHYFLLTSQKKQISSTF